MPPFVEEALRKLATVRMRRLVIGEPTESEFGMKMVKISQLTPLALSSDVERYSEKHILLHCPLFQQSSRQEEATPDSHRLSH